MTDQEADEAERFLTIDGRRWRRSDPAIPATLRQQLVDELMSARRAVKVAGSAADAQVMRDARARVHDAKLALGERGQPWWESPTPESVQIRLAAAIRCLLRHRDDGKTICPSEAARVVGGADWRELMQTTREVAWQLDAQGWLSVTRRGEPADPDGKGPVRLRRNEPP